MEEECEIESQRDFGESTGIYCFDDFSEALLLVRMFKLYDSKYAELIKDLRLPSIWDLLGSSQTKLFSFFDYKWQRNSSPCLSFAFIGCLV
jgi:hypothetical protein